VYLLREKDPGAARRNYLKELGCSYRNKKSFGI
jgi:hypothetical protein